jgi:hypothetical protein
MGKLANIARMTVSGAPGTGNITLLAAVSPYITFANAGVKDGEIVSYGIRDGANSEVGIATYSSTGPALNGRTVTNSTNANAAISCTSAAEVFITMRATDVREQLIATRNFYVLTTGSDSNNGLVNTAGGAFLTIQKAINTIYGLYDLGANFNAIINVGAGTFGGFTVPGPQVGMGAISVVGAGLASTTIAATSVDAITVAYGASVTITDLKVQTTTSGNGFSVSGQLFPSNIAFGACAGSQILCLFGGQVYAQSKNFTINGNATNFINVTFGGYVFISGGTTTLTGPPAYSGPFVTAQTGGHLWLQPTWSGTATGQRFDLWNSDLYVGTNVLTTLPGSTAGILRTGSGYDSWIPSNEYGLNLIGGSIVCSVAASALTIAIKTDSGADPSATGDGVNVLFRNATLTGGDTTQLVLTAATSLVITSGATMGALNGLPFRLWVVGFNDAGTFRLGVINCMGRGGPNNTATQIFPLDSWNPKSSTLMSATSDNAATFYTGVAVSAKAFTVLGFLDYDSGLSTAGTWASVPTRISLWRLGMPLPGNTIQTVYTEGSTSSNRTSSTFAASVVTASITPVSPQNAVKIIASATGQAANPTILQTEIRRGTTLRVGMATQLQINANVINIPMVLRAIDNPGVATSTAYTVYFASSDNATSVVYPQSSYASSYWSMQLDEIMA